jgi:hypothetical protein
MLLDCLFAYRSTPSSVTGKSPMAMLLSFCPVTPLSTLKKNVKFKLVDKEPRKSEISNHRHKIAEKIPSYQVNQFVWVNLNKKSKQAQKYEVGKVVSKLSKTVYSVKILSDQSVHKVHVNQLREYYMPKHRTPTSIPKKSVSKTPSPKQPSSVSPPSYPSPVCHDQPSPRSPGPNTQQSTGPYNTPRNTPQQNVSSRGRLIRPPKRFTLSEYD